MPRLLVTDRAGVLTALKAVVGQSVMEIIRDGGIADIQAVCGGCASCATCHVYVDAAYAGVLPAMTDQEDDLLGISDHRLPSSRLSCQIQFTDALDGLAVTIAPED